MKVYYLQSTKNDRAEKENYDVFLPEIFTLIGTSITTINESEISTLSSSDALFIGEGDYSSLKADLTDFCTKGGLLVAINSTGVEDLCNINLGSKVRNQTEFSVNGHLVFNASEYVDKKFLNYSLPVIDDIRVCSTKENVKILAKSKEFGLPLITKNVVGDGKAVYVAFSLTKTLWYKTQGRPVNEDLDGCGFLRMCDAIIVDNTDDLKLPVVDFYLRFIENLLYSHANFVFIHQLPADDKGVPYDYIMHFCGDEDWCGKDVFEANDELGKFDIPYHVHMQPLNDGTFKLSKEDFIRAKEQGVQFGLHFDFMTNGLLRYDYDALKKQLGYYLTAYGETPSVSNTHCFIYNGFGETLHWFDDLGINGFMSYHCQKVNHTNLNEMNMYGFSFGTSYPTHTYLGKANGNKKSGAIGMRVGFYEPRVHKKADEKQIEKYIDLLKEYSLIGNIFIHPLWFVCDKKPTVKAVEKIVSYAKKDACGYFYTIDVANWWADRCNSSITPIGNNKYNADFKAQCSIKVPQNAVCYVDGKQVLAYKKTIANKKCTLFTIPKGQHVVELKYL